MYTNYYAEHTIFVDSVRKLVEAELKPRVNEWEKAGNFPDEVFRILGQQGFLGILIPEEYDGVGGDYRMAGAWCEAFGELPAVGLTTGVNMHSLVISHSLAKYGSKAAKDRWLRRAVAGEAIGAYAFSEPGAGSDLANIRTRAVREGSKWILNGSKTFITNGARADFILVLSRNDVNAGYKGFTTFVLDTSLPGFKVNKKLDKLGWRSSDTAELTFENVELDDSCVLGNVGDGWIQASNNLNWERMMLTLLSLGGMRAILKDSVRYAQDRKAFGKSISEFGAVSNMLQQMYMKLVTGESLCHHALDLLCEGKPCRAEVSMAKRQVCEDAIWMADRAIQIHGGYGYTTEFSPERWWRDLRIMTIGGGTSEIMANIVVKEMELLG
ncbi:MAG: acyl-CoA dehydrogenase family protein [Deltaproteobacteria bacterium]|nr:acyl-CoA dehydrogenase family protein [Deltaproteobacteria bacterium]